MVWDRGFFCVKTRLHEIFCVKKKGFPEKNFSFNSYLLLFWLNTSFHSWFYDRNELNRIYHCVFLGLGSWNCRCKGTDFPGNIFSFDNCLLLFLLTPSFPTVFYSIGTTWIKSTAVCCCDEIQWMDYIMNPFGPIISMQPLCYLN